MDIEDRIRMRMPLELRKDFFFCLTSKVEVSTHVKRIYNRDKEQGRKDRRKERKKRRQGNKEDKGGRDRRKQ
jgi:hypothetical protein